MKDAKNDNDRKHKKNFKRQLGNKICLWKIKNEYQKRKKIMKSEN